MAQAGALLAAVVGQDLDEGEDGVFRIARRVARDRVISTVDPDARHGHKTSARGFDGYKGHVAVDCQGGLRRTAPSRTKRGGARPEDDAPSTRHESRTLQELPRRGIPSVAPAKTIDVASRRSHPQLQVLSLADKVSAVVAHRPVTRVLVCERVAVELGGGEPGEYWGPRPVSW
jgi:hypothetical protein